MQTREIKQYRTAQASAEAIAKYIEILIPSDVERFDIALSGGNSPKILFDVLAAKLARKNTGIKFIFGGVTNDVFHLKIMTAIIRWQKNTFLIR